MLLTRSAVAACVLLSVAAGQDPAKADEVIVTGRVCDPDGAPIEGACLAAITWQPPIVQEVLAKPQLVTGADGRFRIAVQRQQRLLATAKGRLSLAVQIATPGPELQLGDFVLANGTTWFGRVRSPDGKPIAGAKVQASEALAQHGHAVGPQFVLAASAITGADGIYRLEGVPENGLLLEFRADGHLTHQIPLADRSTPIAIELQPAVWCRGRLDPMPAKATLRAHAEGGATFEGRIEADGTFAVAVPGDRRYRVFCHAAGFAQGKVWSAILTGPQEQVALGTEGSVEQGLLVHVVDEATRKPVAEFGIAPYWNFQHSLHPGHLYSGDPMTGTRGRDGVVRLIPQGDWHQGNGILFVRAPGLGEVFFNVDKPNELPNREPIVIALPAERRITGVVRDANDKPVAGVEVWPVPIDDGSLGYGYKPSNLARTDAEGRFTLPGLGPRRYAVQAFAEGCTVPQAAEVNLAQETPPVQIRLETGKTRQVQWRNRPAGAGWFCTVANLTHSQQGPANWSNGNPIAWRAIDPATPLLMPDLGEGSRLLVARPARGRVPYPVLFDCTDQAVIDLAALRPAILHGNVKLPGALRGQVMVCATPSQDHANLTISHRTPVATDGSYQLEVPPGSYKLTVQPVAGQSDCWHHADELTIEAGATSRCDLVPDIGWVRVELAPHADGAPLRGRYLMVTQGSPFGNRGHTYQHLPVKPVTIVPTAAGNCTVKVWLSGRTLDIEERYDNVELVTGEVEVEAGREAVLKLQEPPPAPAPPPDVAR